MHTPRPIVNDSSRSKWNSGASTIPFGSAVKQGVGDDAIVAASLQTDVVIGLLANRDLEYAGWQNVQTMGQAIGIAGTGGVRAGYRLTVDLAVPGRLVEANPSSGTTVAMVGVANRTAREGELFEVELAGPGASLTG